jgi:hypothetical protein
LTRTDIPTDIFYAVNRSAAFLPRPACDDLICRHFRPGGVE